MASDQYSKLHRTLTQMPPQMSPQLPPKQERNNIVASSRSPHRSSMPPLSLDEETPRQSRQQRGPLTASLNAPSSPVAWAGPEDSFTRDFFGSKHRSANKPTKRNTWFSKRNMKIDENENDSHDDQSNNSLRDPLNNLPSIAVRRQPPQAHVQQNNSDRTFDYDYGTMERGTMVDQMQVRQNQQRQRDQQQPAQSEQPRQLKTLQEHVRRRHQESANSPDSPTTARYEPAAAWAAAAPPVTRQQSDAESSWMERHAMEEAMSEMRLNQQTNEQRYKSVPYEEPDDRQIYRDQQQRSRRMIQSQRYELQHQNRPQQKQQQQQSQQQQRQNQQYSKREYIQDLRSQVQLQHQENLNSEDEWEDTSLIHDIIRSTEARGRGGTLLSRNQVLAELGIRLDEQEQTSGMREQRHNMQRYQQPRQQDQDYRVAGARAPQPQRNQQQNYQSQQERRASKLPDDQTWIQDVLHSAKKGKVSADVLDALIESVAEDQMQQQPNHRDSVDSWMVDALKSAKKGNYSADVLETLMESVACADDEESSAHNSQLEGEQRNSSDSWIIDALQSAKRDGYSADALRTLVETVGASDGNAGEKRKPPSELERSCFRDRNSVDSWMADAQRASSANPDILEELMGTKGGKTGHDSGNMMQYSDIYRDSRGPVPTDDMLNDSLISLHSSSNGSRKVGDNIMVVQRKKPDNGAPAAFPDSTMASSGAKECGDNKYSDGHGDSTIARDLIDQLGPDVDIETIPNDVLKAFGLTRNQLRRAESVDEQARSDAAKALVFKSSEESRAAMSNNDAAKALVFKSSEDSRTAMSNEIDIESKQKCCRKSSADDEVSWVEDSPSHDRTNVSAEKGQPSLKRSTSETSSRRESLSSSLREIATDNRGPIPEADILEEAFSGGSTNRESMAGSSTNLIHVIDNKSSSQNADQNADSNTAGELKPSTGFTRHCLRGRNTPVAHEGSTKDDLDAVAMKKRLEILAIIERERQRTA
jgi:hypothetical protein